MGPPTPFPVTPRRDGDPVPDVLGMRLAHRAMLRDAGRLTTLAGRLADGLLPSARPPDGERRAGAVARYVRDWADSVHHHHVAEDEVLWPVLLTSAGPHVDLSELGDDHRALDPMLARLRTAADAFAAHPAEERAAALAGELAELRDALTEHVAEEEAQVFPLVRAHVSVRDWAEVERRVRRRARLSFELPRVVVVVTPQEWPAVAARAGLPLRLAMAVLGPSFRRRERAVFGAPQAPSAAS